MTELFLLTDQHQNFLDKEGQWLNLHEATQNRSSLYRTAHKDEAINQKVEYIVKNPEVRIALTAVAADEKGLPLLASEDLLTAEEAVA